ncbi:MAG TPA: carbohydrate-binding family 9-like protein [Pyrinomonadaceae bacterium]|nr:carbohydrate-binding family 9-like protein [Pyrinomonadaceae bacterium]
MKSTPFMVSEINIEDTIIATRISVELAAADLDDEVWERASAVHLTRYWSGADAPPGRHAEARLLWSDAAMHVRFRCRQDEPLIVNTTPQTEMKTMGLWERDVCEIFVAPDAGEPERYFEFEAAPTAEWLDLMIRQLPEARETDWDYQSGMTAAARIADREIIIAMRIPFTALGHTPATNDRWRTNLFRCVGEGDERGYLAWRPTHTPRPNFHVPQAFGWLKFKG